MRIELIAVYVEEERAEERKRGEHDRMIVTAAADLSGGSGDDIHRTRARRARLGVGAVAIGASIAAVLDHRRGQSRGNVVMPIDQHRPLVTMTVAGQDKIDTTRLENRHDVLTHLAQFTFGIRVMRTLAVRRMMPERDDPCLRRAR